MGRRRNSFRLVTRGMRAITSSGKSSPEMKDTRTRRTVKNNDRMICEEQRSHDLTNTVVHVGISIVERRNESRYITESRRAPLVRCSLWYSSYRSRF